MFEIDRQPLITKVRCSECRASIEINSDTRRLIEKSVTEFQKRHQCGGRHATNGRSVSTGVQPGSPLPS
jgi:hypothetical protein